MGDSRFDDPRRRFLAFRAGLRGGGAGAVPPEWFATRRIARLVVTQPGWRAIDLRSPKAIAAIRHRLASEFAAGGYATSTRATPSARTTT